MAPHLALHRLRAPRPGSLLGIALRTLREIGADRVPVLAASLSFSAALSLAPLVIVALSVAGLLTEQGKALQYVQAEIGRLLGPDTAALIEHIAQSQHGGSAGRAGAIIGAITLLIGATAVFVSLQDGFNVVWDVEPKPGRGLRTFVRRRLLSLAMVVSLGFLLMVSLLMSALLTAVAGRLSDVSGMQVLAGAVANLVVSLVVSTLLFALLFRTLPDARTAWRDLWIGAMVTAVLFHIGEWAIGLYLGRVAVGSQYGAAGALVVLLVWVYYSSLIVFTGAEFTQVWASRHGAGVRPAPHAKRGNRDAPRKASAALKVAHARKPERAPRAPRKPRRPRAQ